MNNPLYQIMCDLDSQGSGDINFETFLSFLSPNVSGGESKEQKREMFALFDDEKTGFLTIGGLRRAVASLHLDWQESELEEMMKQADEDGDGRISF